ncbi:MAG TPA: hypothetical protein ENN80_00435 [Candidatus Hydrogenedentes bacterium]|nr:hypothetical protein [Candidatus Hydrogenedentota bacterium]
MGTSRAYSARRGVPKGTGQDGIALLLALLFIALLSVIVVEYTYEAEVEAALATNDAADLEAYVAAKSAIASAMAFLAADLLEIEQFSGADFDSHLDLWARPAPLEPINGAVMRCTIDDEYGKLNLNALFRMDDTGNEVPNELLIEALRELFGRRADVLGLEENPADAVLDWLDADFEPREFGAEGDFYARLEIPYPCKNGPMDSVDELLLIRGITPGFFFGYFEGDIAPDQRDRPQEQIVPLPELVTVHGDPGGRINLNTAEPATLDALFAVWGLAAPELVDEIIEMRMNDMPFINEHDMVVFFDKPRKNDIPPQHVLTVQSRAFRVYGDGITQNARVRIEAYLWRNPGRGAALSSIEAQESFRILDWRVIR